MLLAACGGHHATAGTAATAGTTPANAPATPTVATSEHAACQQLYARLQRVTAAVDASSELLTNSLDAKQLSAQIVVEQQQLQRSAQLLGQGPVPVALQPATQQLVAALQTFSADFGRAAGPAARGDYQAAVQAMGDQAVVIRIVDAATTIQNACGQSH